MSADGHVGERDGATVVRSSLDAGTVVTSRADGQPRGGVDQARAEAAVRELLIAVGEDPDRSGLRETPARVARAYAEIFAGLWQDPA